jgi:hypothetical protein
MRSIIILAMSMLLASCVTTRGAVESPFYASACRTTGPTGQIDAVPVLSPGDYTSFRASEFTGCPGGRDVVVISWQGEMTVANVDLARNVVGRFFSHFHPGEAISFTELDAVTASDVSTIIFQFVLDTRDAI